MIKKKSCEHPEKVMKTSGWSRSSRYHPVLQRISAWYLPKAEPETRVWLQALGALSEWNSEETRHQVAFWVGSFYGRLDWGSLWKLLRISVWEVSGLSTWRWKKKYLSTSTHPSLVKSCLLGYWVQTIPTDLRAERRNTARRSTWIAQQFLSLSLPFMTVTFWSIQACCFVEEISGF